MRRSSSLEHSACARKPTFRREKTGVVATSREFVGKLICRSIVSCRVRIAAGLQSTTTSNDPTAIVVIIAICGARALLVA